MVTKTINIEGEEVYLATSDEITMLNIDNNYEIFLKLFMYHFSILSESEEELYNNAVIDERGMASVFIQAAAPIDENSAAIIIASHNINLNDESMPALIAVKRFEIMTTDDFLDLYNQSKTHDNNKH